MTKVIRQYQSRSLYKTINKFPRAQCLIPRIQPTGCGIPQCPIRKNVRHQCYLSLLCILLFHFPTTTTWLVPFWGKKRKTGQCAEDVFSIRKKWSDRRSLKSSIRSDTVSSEPVSKTCFLVPVLSFYLILKILCERLIVEDLKTANVIGTQTPFTQTYSRTYCTPAHLTWRFNFRKISSQQ